MDRDTDYIDADGYRANVGIVLMNDDRQVFIGGRWFTVVGIIPDTFTDSVDVVVEGRYNREGTFVATTLLAKCASRYENAPDKYQSTPGYKAAKGPAA